MDPQGGARCGGEGCGGAAAVADTILRKAQESEQEIVNAMQEVEKLFKMVSVTRPAQWPDGLWWVFLPEFCLQVSGAKLQADDAKLSAQNVLMKTNGTKQKVDRSNEELRSLIRHIRDFLTRTCHFLISLNVCVVQVPLGA